MAAGDPLSACGGADPRDRGDRGGSGGRRGRREPRDEEGVAGEAPGAYARDRRRLVQRLREEGIEDLPILHAFDAVPRHHFVPAALHGSAYEDAALPIGHGQTISRPSVHARYLALAGLEGAERVLEVGTGSGFQTALLVVLGCRVHSVERIPELARRASRKLSELGLDAELRTGDGAEGWPAAAPFDVILVGAAAERVPEALLEQLAEGGTLLVPLRRAAVDAADEEEQVLVRIRRTPEGFRRERVEDARFVPLVEEGRGK